MLDQVGEAEAQSGPGGAELAIARARALLALGDIARRRGEDDRAIVFLVQGIEYFGLHVASDGRLSTTTGDPWRVDPRLPFAEMSGSSYPDPKPETFDPLNTWFADVYEHLISLMKATASASDDYPADLDADLLRVAMAPRYSTQRGKALSRVGTHLWRLGRYERSEEALRAASAEYQETERGWSAIADAEQVLAEVLLATGRAAEALQSVDAAIAHFPDVHDLEAEVISISLAQAYVLRARIRAKMTSSATEADRALILDDAKAAANHIKSALEYEGADGTVENVAILLVALGAFEEAAVLLLRSAVANIAEYPKYIDVSTSPSSALDRTGHPHSLWLLLKLLIEGSIPKERFLPEIFAILFAARNFSISAFRNVMERRTAASEISRPLIEKLHSLREQIHLARLTDQSGVAVEALVRSEREIMAQLHQVTRAFREEISEVGNVFCMLQRTLTTDEVYIEFVEFDPISVEICSEIEFTRAERRVAAIFCGGVEGGLSMKLFDLGDEDELLALVGFLNRPYLFGQMHRLESDVAIAERIGWKQPWDADENVVGQLRTKYRERFDVTLGSLVWQMSRYRRWNVGVRGAVAELAFDFLPVHSDYASKQVEIIRDPALARENGASETSSPDREAVPVVIGDPAFGDQGAGLGQSRDLRSWSLDPLPGARAEAAAIASLFGTHEIVGAEATREFFLNVTNPPILHLATHGFFMRPHQRVEAAEAVRSSLDWDGRAANNALARLTRDDPYCHIGLALAGADRWLDDTSESGFSHGTVFGDEIAMMNLLETDLVVLSCCDSGLGLVHVTHGVINLPRAFLSAGAKAVVASLWPLSDEFVQPVMMDFYRYILGGNTVVFALTRAKRDAIARGDPKLVWGAFQLYGSGDHVVQLSPRATAGWRFQRVADRRTFNGITA